MRKIKTKRGIFIPDGTGARHYEHQSFGTIDLAAKDALKHRRGVAWFWFNGTPAPICKKDTVRTLLVRWDEWRTAYQTNAKTFLKLMTKFAGVRH